MNKGRLESLSDGIIVVAATIMVLQLEPPAEVSVRAMAGQWPTLLAYIISFTQIYLFWYSHHTTFQNAKVVNTKIFLVNGVYLFLVSIVSTVTGMVGRNPGSTQAELLYLLVLTAWSLSFFALDRLVVQANPGAEADIIRSTSIRTIFLVGYVLAAVLAFVVPVLCLVVVSVVNVIWGLIILRQ